MTLFQNAARVKVHSVTFAPEADLVAGYVTRLEEKRFSPRTVRNYRLDLRLVETCIGRPLGQASAGDLDGYLAGLVHSGLTSATIRRKQATLRGFFAWAIKAGHLAVNPCENFEPPKQAERLPIHLSTDHVSRFLAALGEGDALALREATMMRCLYYTGMRAGELVGLDVESLRLDGPAPVVKVFGKGSRERLIPAPAALVAELQKWLEVHPVGHGPLFVTMAPPYRRISYDYAYRRFRRVIERAGLAGNGYTPHKLRHTYATRLVNNGVPIDRIQKLLGHKQITTTGIYAHTEIGDETRRALDGIL